MNKGILLTLICALTILVSLSAICASDVNVEDSYSANIDENTALEISEQPSKLEAIESDGDNYSSTDVLKSQDSNILSTNNDAGNVLSESVDIAKTITAQDVTKYYKGNTKYTATFLDNSGSVLVNINVNIAVNGKVYTKTTDSKGIASMDINLKPGTYKVTATNPVTGYSLTTNFNILSTIVAKNVNKVYLDGKKFSATFLKNNGKALSKQYVKFKIKGKTYKVKTDKKGVASISLKTLKKGTYKIITYNKDGLQRTNKVKVVKSSKTSLTASDYTFLKSKTKKIKVKLLNQYGYGPGKGFAVKFKINGKTYMSKTDKNSVATLKLPSLKSGIYTVKYSFSKTANYKASSTKSKVTVIPNKNPTFTVKSTTTFGYGAGTPFKVALTSDKIPLSGQTVKLTVAGTTYTKTTDSNGLVSLPIDLEKGDYTISYSNTASSQINKKTQSSPIKVIERSPTSLNWKSPTSFNQGVQSCQILVLDSNSKTITDGTVKLTVNSVDYTASVASNGYATIKASFTPGTYSVSYTYNGDNLNAPTTGTTSVNVLKITTISMNNVLSAATSLKNYYQNNKQLPNTVTAGGIQFTVPEFLYIMSSAISKLGNSKTDDITYISGVAAPSSPSGDNINSKQLTKVNYIAVANNIVNYINANKQAPNFVSSAVGKISYTELVDASSRILAYYAGNNKQLPNYVTITSGTSNSQSGTGLNEVNTESDLSIYLKATTHCEVDNIDIKKIVNTVTKGATSTYAKANAIFNYVRDTISYSFYYDTKYGAVGTLNSKKGNCVDHSHLLVAMFRTADIPARYVHGTCKFTSGSTYGHVWVQVLINGKWTIADATSSRNSLGTVKNWNTGSFTLRGIYSSISF